MSLLSLSLFLLSLLLLSFLVLSLSLFLLVCFFLCCHCLHSHCLCCHCLRCNCLSFCSLCLCLWCHRLSCQVGVVFVVIVFDFGFLQLLQVAWVGGRQPPVHSSKLPPSESSSFPNQRNEFRSFRSSDYVMWPVCGPRAASIRGEAYSSRPSGLPTGHCPPPKTQKSLSGMVRTVPVPACDGNGKGLSLLDILKMT